MVKSVMPFHDGVGRVDDGVGDGGAQGVIHLAMLFGAAHQGGEVGRIGTAQRIVEADDTATALDDASSAFFPPSVRNPASPL